MKIELEDKAKELAHDWWREHRRELSEITGKPSVFSWEDGGEAFHRHWREEAQKEEE